MKTTLLIPDQILRELKSRAARRGTTLSAIVAETLKRGLASPAAGILAETERHSAVLAEVCAAHARLAGNPVHDLHTAVLMREHGVSEIRTADADFHQFRFLTVVNPFVA